MTFTGGAFRKNAYLLIGFFCFWVDLSFGQDQKLADSLILLYEAGNYADDELEILSRIAMEETNPDSALHYAEILIERASEGSQYDYLYSGYLQRGNALKYQGNNPEALDSYLKSLDFARRSGDDIGIGSLMISIAGIYTAMSNSPNAQIYFSRGIDLLRRTNDSIKIATALLNAGDDYFNTGKLDSALLYTKESEIIFQKIDYLLGQAYSLGNLGMIYAERENDVLAEAHINQAIGILEQLEDYYPISVYLTYMSDIYQRKKEVEKAIGYAQRSLQLATLYGLKEQISEANLTLYKLHESAGNISAALGYYIDHIAYRDSIRNVEAVQQLADLRTNYEVSQKQAEVNLLNQQKKTQKIIVISTAIALFLIGLLALGLYRRNKFIQKTKRIIEEEKNRSEALLLNILPEETAEELKQKGRVATQKFESVTVMFTDFKDFTKLSEKVTPEHLVESIDYYFKKFDAITTHYNLEKIKTIGDAYMCAGGLPVQCEDHATTVVKAAMEMASVMKQERNAKEDRMHFEIRIGIHTGPVVAGIVGDKKWQYDIWGDTVNIASRMETNSEPGYVNVSENTFELIRETFSCRYRGEIEVKNRGSMKMYFVEEPPN